MSSRRTGSVGSALVALALIAGTGCAGGREQPAARPDDSPAQERVEVTGPRISVSYDGGVLVLDRDSLRPVADLRLPGFIRLNPAGDRRHLLVSTADGFRVLDTGVEVKGHGDHHHYYAATPRLTDITHPAPEPGHVVRHAGKVALFSDGAGTVHVLEPDRITETTTPTWTARDPHHGVAVPLTDGELLVSVGTEDGRTGAAVLSADLRQVATSHDCPDLHGEATASDGTVLVGCTDGALLWKNHSGSGGRFVKINSPDEYGRIGNQSGSTESPVVLGDYKTDPDAELEEPTRISLIDTERERIGLVELGTSYSFRSLGRGPEGEALVLGTDGRLHVIDPDTGEITKRIKVTARWQEPRDWQQPRPTLMVEGDTAWVTEPDSRQIHVVHLPSAAVVDTVELPRVPNEITGVGD